MSARDDYPSLAATGAYYVGITSAEREAGAALDEIDRLRALWQAVHDALDQYDIDRLSWIKPAEADAACVSAVAKAVGR